MEILTDVTADIIVVFELLPWEQKKKLTCSL